MADQHSGESLMASFRIKTAHGEVEATGSEEYVERRWKDVEAILNRVGDPIAIDKAIPQIEANDAAKPIEAQQKRSVAKRSGPSCASRILTMQEKSFFVTPKKANDVVDELKTLATAYEGKHVAAALIDLTKRGKLRRLKDGQGEWAYVNP
jgi:hypothetical protein